jgi:zinc protease
LVVLERDAYATSVGVVSVVRGGSGSDPDGKEGLAHLVEHLTFRAVDPSAGTPLTLASPASPTGNRATRRERLIRYSAAVTNGLTSPDSMTFFEFGPPSRLRWLLELEGARLADPLAGIDADAVAAERHVIANESQLRDDPRAGLWAVSQLFPLIFPPKHPYARAMNGSHHTRAGLTLADAQAYAAKTFRPERMTLLVTAPVAAIDLDSIISHLPRSLVGDQRNPVARFVEEAPATSLEMPAAPVLRRTSPLPASQLWIGWTLPGGYGPLGPTAEMLGRWVQEDLDVDQMRQEDPHIRHVASSLIPGQKASALLVRVLMAKSADPDHVARVVSGRVSTLWTRERTQLPLLDRVKARVATELVLNEPPQIVRALEQAQIAALGSQPILRSEALSSVQSLPTSELAKFAYHHLGQQRRQAVLFTPAGVAADAGQGARPASRSARNRSGSLFDEAATWDPMEIPGEVSPVGNIVMKRLSTGLTVIVARRRAAAVTAWLGFPGGYGDADPPLVVELALRLRPDAVDAPKHTALSGRGATSDASIETLEFQAANLGPSLALLFLKATVPIQKWPAQDGLERLLASVNADNDAASEAAAVAYARALFGDHPYARPVTIADLQRVTRADVDSWIGRTYNLARAALIVVGDVNADEVAAYATAFSAQPNAPTWVAPSPVVPPPSLRPPIAEHLAVVITPRPGALTEIRLGCLLPRMTAGDRSAHETLRLTVQERLSTALRFELGDGYSLTAAHAWLRGGTSYLVVSTFVDASALAESLATIRHHWRRWAERGFDGGEVNVGRWLHAGELSLGYLSVHAIAYHLFNDWNADPSSVGRNTLRANPVIVTPTRLSQVFSTCRANAVLGLTGNESAIRQALAQSWPQRK